MFTTKLGDGETLQGNTTDGSEVWNFNTTLAPGSEIYGPLAQTGDSLFVDPSVDLNSFSYRNGIYWFTAHTETTTLADTLQVIDFNDIVRYDPGAPAGSRASVYFDPDSVGVSERLDALSFHTDGDLLVSFAADVSFDGLWVENGDILKFDAGSPSTTKLIFLDETVTFSSPDSDIDGFAFVSDTEMYLSTKVEATVPGLASFGRSEIVLWDGTSGSIVVADADYVPTIPDFQVSSLAVPEVSSLLLSLGGILLMQFRRSRHGHSGP